MCDRCEGADLSLDEVLDEARQLIARRRFAVQSVLGSQRTAEFSCTAGLTAHGLPELIVTGLRHDEAGELLRCWGEYLLDDTVVLPGETLSGRHRIFQAVEVDRPEEHLLLARSLYGDRVRALQLAWTDDRGRWP